MTEQLNKEKLLLINKFEKAMKKRKNIDPEIVKELFPEDQNFYNRFKLLTTTLYNIKKLDQTDDNITFKNIIYSNRANNKNTTSYSSFRNSFNISKKFSPKNSPKKVKSEKIIIEDKGKEKEKKDILNEKDIIKKIEEYKNEQYSNFNKTIEDEKKKEKERIKKYDEEQDPEKKKKIEKELANERADSNKKIIEFQKNIDLNIKKYEEELRKNNNKKTNNENDIQNN